MLGRLEGLTYVTSGYLVVLAALLVLAGALGDTFGRSRVFGIGLAGFGIMSVACGLAPTLEALVVFRLAQGAAGALLVPQALAILTAFWDGEERGRAIGVWASATAAISIAGPLVGALLVQAVSWRAVFLVNVPVVALGLYALRYVPESRDEHATGRFDWLGAVVIAVGVGGLAFGATRGEQQRWQDPIAFMAILLGLLAVALFPALMRRRSDPLVPPDLFRSRAFSVINLSTFVIYGALYVNLAFQQLYLQGVLGYTPTAAALALLPAAILLTLLSTRAGRLAGRLGARRFLVAGPLLMAAGLLFLARVPSTSDAWSAAPGEPASLVPPAGYLVDILPGQLVYGIGLAIMVAPAVHRADGVGARAPGGCGLGDQQRRLAGGRPARQRPAVHRHLGDVLPGARRAGAGPRRVPSRAAAGGAAAHAARPGARSRVRGGRPRGVDLGVPPRHAGRGGPAGGRRRGERRRAAPRRGGRRPGTRRLRRPATASPPASA